jgi:hypothetical protein
VRVRRVGALRSSSSGDGQCTIRTNCAHSVHYDAHYCELCVLSYRAVMVRRLTPEERDELRRAVGDDEIQNATEWAQRFANERGVNAETVRTAISRFRNQQGKLTRRLDTPVDVPKRGGLLERMMAAPASDEEMMRVAAAALLRYASDAEFEAAVGRYMPTLKQAYEFLERIKKNAPWMFDSEGRLIPRHPGGDTSRNN